MIEMEKIRSNTAGRETEEVSPVKRENAVLIPLVDREGELSILFEVRQAGIRQGGEICFPGGMIEKNESPVEAAVRETSEELLIPREKIEVIAPMHVMTGPGGARISSCLGILHDYDGGFSAQEVDHVFTVPLSWFAAHEPPWHSIPRKFYFYESSGGVIWGITAQMLYHCLKVIMREDAPAGGENRL